MPFDPNMYAFLLEYPFVGCVGIGLLFFVSGLFEYKRGLRILACLIWFIGLMAVSLGVVGQCFFFGMYRWIIAVSIFLAGMYTLWKVLSRIFHDRN